MSNTDDMLYEQCKCISEELDELVDKYNNSDDCDEFIEYFDDNYGIDYIWRMGVGLIGVRVLVAFGGPNIYIDTFDGVVRGYWGGTQLRGAQSILRSMGVFVEYNWPGHEHEYFLATAADAERYRKEHE